MEQGRQNQKGFAVAAAVVIGLAVLAAAGVAGYYFIAHKKTPMKNRENITPAPVAQNHAPKPQPENPLENSTATEPLANTPNAPEKINSPAADNGNGYVFAELSVGGQNIRYGYDILKTGTVFEAGKTEVFIFLNTCENNKSASSNGKNEGVCKVIGAVNSGNCYVGASKEEYEPLKGEYSIQRLNSTAEQRKTVINVAKCYSGSCAVINDAAAKNLCVAATKERYRFCGDYADWNNCYSYIIEDNKELTVDFCTRIAQAGDYWGFQCAREYAKYAKNGKECEKLLTISNKEIVAECRRNVSNDWDKMLAVYEQKRNDCQKRDGSLSCLGDPSGDAVTPGDPTHQKFNCRCYPPCVKENEFVKMDDEECCRGFTKVEFKSGADMLYPCVRCGDRLCKKYETRENCPKDCDEPKLQEPRQCYVDSDCQPECGGGCPSRLLPDDGGSHCLAIPKHTCVCRYGECIAEPPNKI